MYKHNDDRMLVKKSEGDFEDLGVDVKIILNYILEKLDVVIWTGLHWLKIETYDGLLFTRQWAFRLRRRWGVSYVAKEYKFMQEDFALWSVTKLVTYSHVME